MSELLPCPFCGEKPKHKIHIDACISIRCMNCGIGFGYFGEKEESNKEAIEKWNARHYPPEVQQAIERMKPKKVIRHSWSDNSQGFLALHCDYNCPVCGGELEDMVDFCTHEGCGQALDWSEDE